MRFWATGFVGPIPAAAIVWGIYIFVMLILVYRTLFGRYLFAVGANPLVHASPASASR